MRIIEGLDALADLNLAQLGDGIAAHCVVAVGVFDGMHLGHQRLIHDLLEMSTELRGTPTVITFENHPDAVVSGRSIQPLINVPHRLRLLRRAGVQRVLLLQFDQAIREISAETFALEVLHQGLRARGLLLGFDSAMGKNREGTPARFAELGEELGFEVRRGQALAVEGQTVSSTLIRDAIARGDLDGAARLLGRRPGAFGEVVHGHHRGRDLGFPTANLLPQDQVLPPAGVYAVEILHEGEQYVGVANLGNNPTFEDPAAPAESSHLSLEVHFLDCDLEIYGATLEVTFVERLRQERKFESIDQLRDQIAADILAARRVLDS
ncbi:MAG: riboflavin biosynthesis protein RibF [Planctomycetota bacterium]|nr:riboflavin biosynthesis protein RibF [Planctomycetota bacterium]